MKKMTYQRLRNITLYYLERFDSSSYKLRSILTRRVQKETVDQTSQESSEWIIKIINEMVDLGYINDERYTENKIRKMSLQGKSNRYIFGKLSLEGIPEDLIKKYLIENDLDQARIFVQKKKLGFDYQKDLAKLARAGFTYEISTQALKEIQNV